MIVASDRRYSASSVDSCGCRPRTRTRPHGWLRPGTGVSLTLMAPASIGVPARVIGSSPGMNSRIAHASTSRMRVLMTAT